VSTSVKISGDAKRLLDSLQAKLILGTGRRVSQQELLDEVVKFPKEREEEIVRRLAGVMLPLSRREIEALMRVPTDWGLETREEEIDQVLYGRRRRG